MGSRDLGSRASSFVVERVLVSGFGGAPEDHGFRV